MSAPKRIIPPLHSWGHLYPRTEDGCELVPWPDKPGPQPHNLIGATFEEERARVGIIPAASPLSIEVVLQLFATLQQHRGLREGLLFDVLGEELGAAIQAIKGKD